MNVVIAKLEAHKKKEKEEREARAVEEFFAKNPELQGKYQIIKKPEALPKTSKSVAKPMPSSSKRRADVISVHTDDGPIDTVRQKKSRILMVSKGVALFPISCDHYQEHDRREANCDQAMQKTEAEVDSGDDVETEGETKHRRSTRIANEVSGNDNVVAQAIRSQTIELANMTTLLKKIDERLDIVAGDLHNLVY